VNVLQVIFALEKRNRNLLVHPAHTRLLINQSHALLVLLENLHLWKDQKNAWIVHRVGTVETKTLIHPYALIVHWGNFLLKRANLFVWRATQEALPAKTVRRSAKYAQRDLNKVRNVVPDVFGAKTVCCPTKIPPTMDGKFKAMAAPRA
jgi:hypothetical protein